MRAAEELPCLAHGNRIPNPQLLAYTPDWMHDKETLADWETTDPEHKKQYEKAVNATRA
jgi:hypothetical protein